MTAAPWSLHLLSEVLAAFSVDSPSALGDVIHRVAESVDAEIMAIVRDGELTICSGLLPEEHPCLLEAADPRTDELHLGDRNYQLFWVPLGPEGVLAVGRASEPFTLEERALLRGMGRCVLLSLQVIGAVQAEKEALRAEQVAKEEAIREATLDHLTGLPNRRRLLRHLQVLLQSRPAADIAVLKVESDKPLPAVAFGDSDTAQVGDWVMAIGNPFGLGGTVTLGIVSARGRDIRQGLYDDFIQTDAAINRGNSGGPLFNMDGQVVGINTAIYSPTGGSIGIGFSIPSNLARNIVAQLEGGGKVRRGWLGVNIQQVTDEIAESLGLTGGARGALVARAQEDGPAFKSGIKNGDVVLKFNGQDVKEMRSLPRIVADTPVGLPAPVLVWRDGKEVTVNVTVGELPGEQQVAAAESRTGPQAPRPIELSGLGLHVAPLNNELRDRFSLKPEQKGVVIMEVAPGSAAAERELRPGDVIAEVQQERVNTPSEVQARLEALRKQNRPTALFLIETPQGQRFVPLRLKSRESGKPG